MSFRFRAIELATARSIKDWDRGPDRAGFLGGGPTRARVEATAPGPSRRVKMKAPLEVPGTFEGLRNLGIRWKVGTRTFFKEQTHQVIANILSRPKIGQIKPNSGIDGLKAAFAASGSFLQWGCP